MGLLDDAIREHLDLKRRRGADPTEVDQLERDALGPVRRGPQVSDEALPDDEHFEHDEHFDLEEHDELEEHGERAERADHLDDDEPFGEAGPFGEDEPFADPDPSERHSGSALLYDDQAEEPVQGSARSAPAPEFADEPPEREERSWSYDSAEVAEFDEPGTPADAAPPTRESPAAPSPEPPAPSPPPARADTPAAPPEPSEGPPEHPGQETVEYDVEAEHERDRSREDDDVLEETPEFLQDTPDHDRLWFEQRPPRPFDFDK